MEGIAISVIYGGVKPIDMCCFRALVHLIYVIAHDLAARPWHTNIYAACLDPSNGEVVIANVRFTSGVT